MAVLFAGGFARFRQGRRVSVWGLRLYGLLMGLAQPFLRRKLKRRSRQEPGYGEAVEERFGQYTQPAETSSTLLWVHAVSLGETRAAEILLKALRAQYPGQRILLTHGTATGRAEGRGLLQAGDIQVWQPWDSPAAAARFLDHFKPRLGLLMETEIWPCTLHAAKKRSIPMVLANARLSEKSLRQALRMSPLSYPAYGSLAAVYAQTGEHARRFRQLGVEASVFGNLKFDARPTASQMVQGKGWRQLLGQPVVLFASSREGEETVFFEQISALVQAGRAQSAINKGANKGASEAPGPVRFLVVPRHPQRFDEVAALARQQGLRVSRRSSWDISGPGASNDALSADVWLGDSLGEMALYYALSDVALLGGSFLPLGGQNLIEAAACGCPVVMGPHTFNFADAARLAEAAGAAQRVGSLQRAVQAALHIASDPNTQGLRVAAGLVFAEQNRGATDRTLAALRVFLSPG
jgi:3-deoxy-D-manno-octulosonic-acid transferase